MKYLNPSFTIPPADKVAPGTCEACVYGTGDHAPTCQRVKVDLPVKL